MKPLQGKALYSVQNANRRVNLWEGAVRSGKTVSSLIAFLRFVRDAPPGPMLLAGRTERTVKANVIDPLVSWLGTNRCRYVKGSGELVLLGRRISVVGASTEQAEEKIRGRTLIGAYLDEVTLMPETFFKRVLSQLSLEGARLFGTTNPDSPFHWLKSNYIDRQSLLDMRVFHFNLEDNPSLPKPYVEQLKAEYGGPGTLFYKRFIEGLWVMAEGAVYDMWSDRHIVPGLPPASAVAAAWTATDYATSSVVSTGLFLHVKKPIPHILVAREFRHDVSQPGARQLTDEQLSKATQKWLAEELEPFNMTRDDLMYVFVDPSAASFIQQLHGDGFKRVWGADNSVIDGIRDVSKLLAMKPPRLVSSDTNVGGNREMSGYSWDPKRQKLGEDKPIKERDHFPDMLRYGIRGSRRIWMPWVRSVRNEAA